MSGDKLSKLNTRSLLCQEGPVGRETSMNESMKSKRNVSKTNYKLSHCGVAQEHQLGVSRQSTVRRALCTAAFSQFWRT